MVAPKNYKKDEFIHFIGVKSENNTLLNLLKDNPETKWSEDKFEISFEDIERFNLNKIGNEIPYAQMNVVNIERYMLYFWSLIMDSDCILLYLHLWEYCDRTNGVDICYPKLDELQAKMGMARKTLLKRIRMLEDNNFLIQIRRLNKKANNQETSPILKLRQTIPMLSREQYYKLPPFMQMKHDEYMEKFVKDGAKMEMFSPIGSEIKRQLVDEKGNKLISAKVRAKIDQMVTSEEDMNYIREHLPINLRECLIESREFHEHLQRQGMSKPASEFIFKDCIVTYDVDSMTVHIIAIDESSRDYIQENLNEFQKDVLLQTFIELYKNVYDYRVYTRKNYIMKVIKGTH